ncbi:MAG: redoxin domain-containing protein [Prevotella sp.]|nr:AhpC/TSA family protein [Prevotella sp.]MDD7709297.1 redoxin domain-containing protein [Prevotella sp.]MDY4150919.1 redoxin domain-containing protein [Prevotella sp.]
MNISKTLSALAVSLMMLGAVSCSNKKFEVSGNITDAKDSLLYFENMSLNGAVVVDSTKLDADGNFSFAVDAPSAPEFYRLRIAGQIINVAADSTEHVTIKAAYPTMASQYEVSGSDECSKIKELAIGQMALQASINNIVRNTNLNDDVMRDSIRVILAQYKEGVKNNYIFKEPMKAYAYFALFQTIALGYENVLVFNPRSNEDDVKVFAAVATSWDTYYPKAERGLNLHNIAIEGLKNIRIMKAEQQQTVDPSKVEYTGVIDIALPDNKGNIRKLSSLKGKVVMLDFHLFATKESTARIMQLRELYNKYHAQGFEIYQVSIDPDEHFWKTSVAALPWICVHSDDGLNAAELGMYNVRDIPTYFLIDKNNVLQKRDVQIKDIDAEIKALL